MSVSIDAASAQMTVDIEDASPATDITPNGRWAVLHLTRNAHVIINGERPVSEREGSAINIEGKVDVRLGSRGELSKFSFHFIQLMKLTVAQTVYLGRRPAEGSMMINYATPPVFPRKFAYEYALDSTDNLFGKNVMPFTNLRDPVIFQKQGGGVTIVTDMDDHPQMKMKLAFRNEKTGSDNFLYRAHGDKSFLTAFVVRNEAGVIQPLAHVTWQIVWRAFYEWADGRCHGTMAERTFRVDKVVKGPPADSSLAAMITKPTTDVNETANALAHSAIQALNRHKDSVFNFSQSDRWPLGVPGNFFK